VVGTNWIDSLSAKSLLTSCARLASTIGSTESVIQVRETPRQGHGRIGEGGRRRLLWRSSFPPPPR
jgi:hypothetical protein